MHKYWETQKTKANPLNQQLINDFLFSMKLANQSVASIETYRKNLEALFIDINYPVGDLTPDDIHKKMEQKYKKYKERSIALYISILASFFNYCKEEGYIKHELIKKRWRPRIPKSIPLFLGKSEQARINLVIERLSLRDRTMVELLLASGCRLHELQQLNIEDIDIENKTAMVLGKRNKFRIVHFNDRTKLLLEKYISSRKDDNPALFINYKFNRISRRRIQYIIEDIGKSAKLDKNLSPHRFRHTFATNLITKGADISFISEELGHSNIDTTRIYAQLPQQELISLYRKYMG